MQAVRGTEFAIYLDAIRKFTKEEPRMAIQIKHTSLAVSAMLLFSGAAAAQDEPMEARQSDAEHCISLRLIDRTDVLDDQNILFHMRSGLIYRNALPHRCPGLRFEDSFMYRTSIGQLCDLDIVTVLDNRGFGFTTGVSCGLGLFYPLTEEEAENLKEELGD
jgi:hypothetical protein